MKTSCLIRFAWLAGLLLLCLTYSAAQSGNRLGKCQSPDFDRKVASLLSFSVPALDVDSLVRHKDRYVVLDAREAEEYRISHIPGARFVGYEKFDAAKLGHLSRHTPLLVYCSIGYRSEKIAEKLKKAGFSKVYNLYGSVFEWANRGYGLVDEKGKPTRRLHTYNRQWSQWADPKKVQRTW